MCCLPCKPSSGFSGCHAVNVSDFWCLPFSHSQLSNFCVAVIELIVFATMAESDRSRSPVPARNRLDPRGQPQSLPFFPRWCGPMSAAVRHLSNMPRQDLRIDHHGQLLSRDLTLHPLHPTLLHDLAISSHVGSKCSRARKGT